VKRSRKKSMSGKKEVIVFDFDKTLTCKDTLFGFYLRVSGRDRLRCLRLFFYFISMAACKFNLISNTFLKKVGFTLFLRGKSSDLIEKYGNSYSKEICFNKLFKSFKFSDRNRRIIIISASYEVYLKSIFNSDVEIFGSKYDIEKNVLTRFLFNCYGYNKRKVLSDKEIFFIDELYTDSLSDRALALISRTINIVRNDKIIRCSNIREFDDFFRK
jgi:phosphoserine phosphatase